VARRFERAILLVVLFNCATLATETSKKPGYATSSVRAALDTVDAVVVAIFTVRFNTATKCFRPLCTSARVLTPCAGTLCCRWSWR
jgi:hypothetical protein